MKCYVVIISEKFPKTHKRSGDDTGFPMSIKHHNKIHTIRMNYELWKGRFEKIDKGEAYISIRIWEGLPYRSKQREIFKYDKTQGIGLQKLEVNDLGWLRVGNKTLDTVELAEHDGLNHEDFKEWFKNAAPSPKAIIHFTEFRYN